MEKQVLQQKLKEFGLNPTHWKIKKIREKYYSIQSRAENGLALVGVTSQKNNQLSWEEIFWIGI